MVFIWHQQCFHGCACEMGAKGLQGVLKRRHSLRNSLRTREGSVVVGNLRLASQTVGASFPSSPVLDRTRPLEASQDPLLVTCALYAANLLHLHSPVNNRVAVRLSSLSSYIALCSFLYNQRTHIYKNFSFLLH